MEEKLLPGATRDDKQLLPPPRRHPGPSYTEILQMIAVGLTLVSMVAVCALTVAGLLYHVYTDVTDPSRRPEVFAAVGGCSGLDVDAGVPRAFNLTLAVDNLGSKYNFRVGAGDAVVLYGGVPLATGVVEELRVQPRSAGELAIRAASGGVGLPDELAAAMAEEAKRAGGVVGLEVRVLSLNGTSLICTATLKLGGGGATAPPATLKLGGGGAAAPAAPPCERMVLMDESDGVMKKLLSHYKYDSLF